MGKTLRRVIGGLATGAGNYLVTKATEDAKTAREERLFQRQQVLDALSHSRDVDKLKIQGTIQEGLISKTGEQTRLNAVTTGTVQQETDAKRAAAETTRAVQLEVLRNKHDVAKLKLSQDGEMKLAQFNASKAASKVVDYQVDDQGMLVGLTAEGKPVKTNIKAGVDPDVAMRAAASGDEGGNSLSKYRPDGGGDSKTGGLSQQDYNVLYNRWGNATPQSHPGLFAGGKKLPFEEVLKRYQGQ